MAIEQSGVDAEQYALRWVKEREDAEVRDVTGPDRMQKCQMHQ